MFDQHFHFTFDLTKRLVELLANNSELVNQSPAPRYTHSTPTNAATYHTLIQLAFDDVGVKILQLQGGQFALHVVEQASNFRQILQECRVQTVGAAAGAEDADPLGIICVLLFLGLKIS